MDAVALMDPAGHAYPAVHVSLQGDTLATLPLYVPAVQDEQTGAPARLNVPEGQTNAVALLDPSGQACPALQTPLHATLLAPATPNLPLGQAPLQAAEGKPAVSPYLPAGQSVHADAAAALNLPAGHTLVFEVDPGGHANPAAQAPLHAGNGRPGAPPYVPPGQSVQVPAPARLYCPAGHMNGAALVDPAAHAYPAAQRPLHVEVFSPVTEALNQVPAGHAEHATAAERLYWPAGHSTAVAMVDPTAQAKPATQAPLHTGDVSPGTSPYVPPGHNVQVPAPARLYRPTGQMDAVALVDPAAHACPAAQGPLHVDAFSPTTEALNQVPAGHAVHTAAAAWLYWPVGHGVGTMDPAGQACPAGQIPAQDDDERPMTSLKVPPAQSAQAAAPAKLYRPAGQIEAVALVDPARHAYPAVQFPLHTDEFNPTVAGLNQVPPGHVVHNDAAGKLYWPAGHAMGVAVPVGQACPAVQFSLHALARPET
jgi:hypothetical protein